MSNSNIDNIEEIKTFISTKEEEIKTVLINKIKSLQITLTQRDSEILELHKTRNELKEAYCTNGELLQERDKDGKIYEDKFDSIEEIIKLKDIEINKLKATNEETLSKLRYEKAQKSQNDEHNKYNLDRLCSKYKEELSSVNEINNKYRNDLEELKLKHNSQIIDLKNEVSNANAKIKTLSEEIQDGNKGKNNSEIIITKHKNEVNELNGQISKLNNDNLALIKEKITVDNKIKFLESKEQETNSNIYLANQKVKYTQTECDRMKEQGTNLNNKIDYLIKQNDELKEDVFTHKQTIQLKEFEIEKEKFSNKGANEKIKDGTKTIEKLLCEKSNSDITYSTRLKSTSEEIISLKEQIDQFTLKIREGNEINNKIVQENKEIIEVNSTLNKEKKNLEIALQSNNNHKISLAPTKSLEESVADAVDFFSDTHHNNNLNNHNLGSNRQSEEIISQLKQKEIEFERLKQEKESNETQGLNRIKEYEMNLNEFEGIKNENKQYVAIIESGKSKIDEMEAGYKGQIEKIEKAFNETGEDKSKLIQKNKKLKRERDKLIKLCSDLKIEVNRLENNLHCANTYINNCNTFQDDDMNMNSQEEKFDDNNPINDIERRKAVLGEGSDMNFKRQNINNYSPSKNTVIEKQVKETLNNVMRYADKKALLFSTEHEDNEELTDYLKIDKVDPIEASSNKLKLLKRSKLPNS